MPEDTQPIKGYRALTEQEIARINRVKQMGDQVKMLVDDLRTMGPDHRWLAIGETNIQQGLMALTRSIAKPEHY